MSKQLFKEAIAEAKSVREAAIANAKKSLEESLTPHLKSMLAAKLQEMEEEEDDTPIDGNIEEATDSGFKKVSFKKKAVKTVKEADEENDDEAPEETSEETPEETPEENPEEMPEENPEEDKEIGDLSVEEFKDLIRDIISQEMGGIEEPAGEEPGSDMDNGEIPTPEFGGEEGAPEGEEGEEEINLDELLRELEGSVEDENEGDEFKEKFLQKETELNEALKVINTLKAELKEINLLNSKLLYVNKIFKANNLTESQKVNVITAFDKAESTREAKLVYETVSKSVSMKSSKPAVIKEHRGAASNAAGTNPSKNVIPQTSDVIRRMQKLAGITPEQ